MNWLPLVLKAIFVAPPEPPRAVRLGLTLYRYHGTGSDVVSLANTIVPEPTKEIP